MAFWWSENQFTRSLKCYFTDYHECCYLPDDYKLTYDPRFKDAITFEVFCQQRAPSHLQEEQLDLKEMKTAFDKNMKKVCLTKYTV